MYQVKLINDNNELIGVKQSHNLLDLYQFCDEHDFELFKGNTTLANYVAIVVNNLDYRLNNNFTEAIIKLDGSYINNLMNGDNKRALIVKRELNSAIIHAFNKKGVALAIMTGLEKHNIGIKFSKID